jgi:hypothetical protein
MALGPSVWTGRALQAESDDLEAWVPGPLGLFQAHSMLKFFDLAGVEKFKRRWARGERLQRSHEFARSRHRKVLQ